MDNAVGSGYELLKEEMKARGLTPSQIASKTVAVVLDIIANAEDKTVYLDVWEAKRRLSALESKVDQYQRELSTLEKKIAIAKKSLIEEKEELQEYIDEFYEKLEKCETPEGKDALRRAQMFRNSVDIDTSYDNYAYIVALGAILSCGGYEPMSELRKIDRKLPEIVFGNRSIYWDK